MSYRRLRALARCVSEITQGWAVYPKVAEFQAAAQMCTGPESSQKMPGSVQALEPAKWSGHARVRAGVSLMNVMSILKVCLLFLFQFLKIQRLYYLY